MINKLRPTSRHTNVKVVLISLLPFKLDKWAPKYPPVKDPNIRIIDKFKGIEPILLRKIAPVAFQKIPTEKKVKLTALRKSIWKKSYTKKHYSKF